MPLFTLGVWLLLRSSAADPRPTDLTPVIQAARAQRLAHEPAWHRLLHYRRSPLGSVESEAAGPDFFLANKGRTDPEAELEATLTAFFEPVAPGGEHHPQCRFPARLSWLADRLALDSTHLIRHPCPRYREWRRAIGPLRSVTVVFADAYINSPASMYGHTLLRLDRRDRRGEDPLLAYTINFAADPTTDNPIFYAVLGVAGGFEGRFSTVPFYMKVQEYSNLESRDLWEYTLNLTAPQIERLLEHAWELGRTYFDYYFFNKNCSYQLLSLIEAARPDLSMTSRFSFRVIPADTLRAVLDPPGLVTDVRYRPSQRSRMIARRDRLNAGEIARVEEIVADPSQLTLPEEASPARRALILDAALDLLRYREGFREREEPEARRKRLTLLKARGRLGVGAEPLRVEPPTAPPDSGHQTIRAGVGGGVTRGQTTFEQLSLRLALHDLMDSPVGYSGHSTLEMVEAQLRVDNDRRDVFLNGVDAIHIVSLSPYDRWTRKPSWKVWTGMDIARELGCDGWRCGYWGNRVGVGTAARMGPWSAAIAYGFLEGALDVGGPFEDHVRLGGGVTGGIWVPILEVWRLRLEGTGLGYVLGERRPNARASLAQALTLSRNTAVTLTFGLEGDYREALAGLEAHF